MEPMVQHDVEGDIIALSFAARLLLTNLDHDTIVERALESLGDFGKTGRLGLFLLDADGQPICRGGLVNFVPERRNLPVTPEDGTILEAILANRGTTTCGLRLVDGIPFPTAEPGGKCLCASLVAASNRVIGLVAFDHSANPVLTPMMIQSLSLLLTIVAIALDTARLFQQAVFDGLTGLFIRRYFDLRLAEEENRIKRYGGYVSILMMDIDHFKQVNDRYGHPQGDVVLKDVADIIRVAARKDVDSPCRYGGEEFVLIMPETDLAGALIVAERIRHRVQSHVFQGPEGPFSVTLSGGVAFMDQHSLVPRAELLQRADTALYHAKENGRNQIEFGA